MTTQEATFWDCIDLDEALPADGLEAPTEAQQTIYPDHPKDVVALLKREPQIHEYQEQ